MLPETIKLIEKAIAETEPSVQSPEGLHMRARLHLNGASYAGTQEAEREHVLRAIAYLVRWLELDAAAPG